MSDETTPSLTETLGAAYDKMAAEPAPAEPVAAVATPEAPIGETAEARAERVRNEDGTFAKAPKEGKIGAEKTRAAATSAPAAKPGAAAPVEAKAGGVPTPPPEKAPPATAEASKWKPPQSWKPAIREKWASLPPEVQEEVSRRESETARVLQESAQARHLATTVQKTLAPYETIARANGQDAWSYAGSVLQSAAQLQMGTQAQKDALLAQLITTYGGNVEGINAHLSGQAAPVQQQQPVNIQAEIQRALQQTLGQARESAATHEATEFVGSAPEFLQDVWQDMVEILRVAESRHQKMDYQQAYDRACRFNEDVAKILEQRKAAEAAKAQSAQTQRSVDAASSVRSTPASGHPAQPKDLESILSRKYDELASGESE